jgi:hypothetical protein
VVALDDCRPRSVPPLDRVRESILDPRVDLEFPDPASQELALDRRDERPHQAPPAVCGIDQHVEKAHAALARSWSRDRESDQRGAVPGRHHDGIAVGRLPPHLALRERA